MIVRHGDESDFKLEVGCQGLKVITGRQASRAPPALTRTLLCFCALYDFFLETPSRPAAC